MVNIKEISIYEKMVCCCNKEFDTFYYVGVYEEYDVYLCSISTFKEGDFLGNSCYILIDKYGQTSFIADNLARKNYKLFNEKKSK